MSSVQNRKIIHIDMDAFFASVEQVHNPKYFNKPLIVGHGVVTTCSYEARNYGVKSAMSVKDALKLCPNAIVIKPHKELYVNASKKIFAIFKKYTDLVEPLSLDEAYLDVTNNKLNMVSATKLAKIIQFDVYKNLNLTCSCGVSFNKFLAKTASDINKPFGIYVIKPSEAQNFLDNLSIIDFFGIGKKTAKKMIDMGIFSGYDLKQLSKEQLEKSFKSRGVFYYNIVRGIDNRKVIANRPIHSIGNERTLQNTIIKKDDVNLLLNNIFEQVYKRLLNKKLYTKTVTIKIKYDNFNTITRSKSLNFYSNNKNELYILIKNILKNIEYESKIKLFGISFSNFSNKGFENKVLKEKKIEQLKLF